MADEETKASPVKAEEAPVEKKGRGRPKKPDSEKKTPTKSPGTGKRGRPKKAESEKKTKPKAAGGKRGRPAKPESEKAKSPKKASAAPNKSHPPVAEMVLDAVAALKDRKGCSLSAVKKYIAGNYKVDMERQAIFIRRYVRKAIDAGEFTLVKGSSTTGSFKLADPDDKKKAKSSKPKGTGKPRGRPKGSTGKSPKKAAKPAKKAGTGKGRGRPKGSGKKKEVKTGDE